MEELNTTENLLKKEIANAIFPEPLESTDFYKLKYPKRCLSEDAMVTRFAPSPTGFLHLGSLYMALISERFAHQSKGVYIVRIEDTDQKRKNEASEAIINNGLTYFGLIPDEGVFGEIEKGNYGPYRQSERKGIYHSFLKQLIMEGKVYPCFSTEEELEVVRAKQSEESVRPGCYGKWALWKHRSDEDMLKELQKGTPFALRLRSQGDIEKRIVIHDLIKGDIEMPENDLDIIVMKKEGLPTYHFAHAIDDHLMRTTHVVRADEWVSSTPVHFELFDTLGFKRLSYGHIAPINKIDESGAKRKLSKRKDLEANVVFYEEQGYTKETVIEYLMNLANSDFEDWRKSNLEAPFTECPLTFAKLSRSNGPLFDEVKLGDIGKEIIAKKPAAQVYEEVLAWSEKYDAHLNALLVQDKAYWTSIFNLEKEVKVRKDIAKWSEVYSTFSFFDKENFKNVDISKLATTLSEEEIQKTVVAVKENIANLASQEEFMALLRSLAKEFGLAQNIKELKANPELRGHVGVVAQVVRYIITGQEKSPDLFEIMKVLGADEVKKRLS